MWRWDQGRLLYFQFNVLERIAAVLVKFDGVKIPDCEEIFRMALEQETGMPFAPSHYSVLRNYKRVFECAFLATVEDSRLFVSGYCKELSKHSGCFENADDYLLSYVSRFRFPFPAFDGYDSNQERIYPFCAILKYLISLRQRGLQASISLDEIFYLVVANHCTGFEDIDFYRQLSQKAYHIDDISKRQIREMVIFISQLSILKFYNNRLWLDIANQSAITELLDQFLVPKNCLPKESRLEEFLGLTKMAGGLVQPTTEVFASDNTYAEFIEGKRKRVEHFRVDRSPLLKKYYREQNQQPICAICHMDVSRKYPWTDYMLDIHHLLPLSSSIAITAKGTSLNDIVGLCPSCHRSIHVYYSNWLKKNNQDDFRSRAEAKDVYLSAAKEIV
ncbi:MAG: hypothetical protein LBJ10_07695 [Clostridiales bacterium]|jgi:hypothetical protein|nr:hypothetical protein [Clostridiales bacterium]